MIWATREDVQKEMDASSDRACAIIGGSYVESCLEVALRTHLLHDEVAFKDALSRGPLSTFHGKIEVAYLSRLLSPEGRHDIHLVRKIRNHFAHNLEASDFETDQMRDLTRNFKKATLNTEMLLALKRIRPIDYPDAVSSRDRFEGAVGEMAGWLRRRFFPEQITPLW
ncbi:hypothetical protein [Pelagibacterium sp. H642]|uniref:hypothetical protein n=1 Tax=Pelagibacterium sp. H642 TaxID=1881069 RepID=UPI0028157343|nr:hypothetical protein [Pelagibacterium sp. H642]WMT90162.1 hypothetical protein NO934_15395 [Pelagibacterium sp. H642]